jgi:large subunit ribosomal protein L1
MKSKRFKKLPEKTNNLNSETIDKLLSIIKKNCTTKFDESVDLSFQINHKQKKGEINIRTVVNLPGGTGKEVKVAVVCEDTKASEALVSSQTTATLTSFPVPPGRLTTVRILISPFFCL